MVVNLSKLSDLDEYDGHELVMRVGNCDSELEGYIAIYNASTKPSCFGATRIWNYTSELEAIKDVLRLSKIMAYKAAMAGLKYGGAKGVIIRKNGKVGNDILRAYAKKVDYLCGRFVTGTDAGMNRENLVYMKRYSKYFVGTNSNPERFTALGVFRAIQICAREIWGNENMAKRSIAIQGLGKTGMELLKLASGAGFKHIIISDINANKVKIVLKTYPNLDYVKPENIGRKKVDILAPCALFHAVNSKNIGKLRCGVIAGTANNQLEKDSMGEVLSKWGILYAPDYVINAGGLISVADEYENGNSRVGRVKKKMEVIEKNIKNILKMSKRMGKATNIIANEMAEKKL